MITKTEYTFDEHGSEDGAAMLARATVELTQNRKTHEQSSSLWRSFSLWLYSCDDDERSPKVRFEIDSIEKLDALITVLGDARTILQLHGFAGAKREAVVA